MFHLLLISGFIILGECRPHKDLITSLPGLDQMPEFEMYSGYLAVSDSKKLHYWLSMRQECCVSDTLIIWFNGGPGCSSLDGFFTENGPFKFDDYGRLITNEYSWNKIGSVLYLEAPAGVGFSLATVEEIINDQITAADNYKALKLFLEQFPEFNYADIYITGESYAGMYIPVLTDYIIQHDSDLMEKIQGLMIGNGYLDEKVNIDSSVYFAAYHALVGSSTWREITKYCCKVGEGETGTCEFYKLEDEDCMMEVSLASHLIMNSGLNMYNIYQDCAPVETMKPMQYYKEQTRKFYLKKLFRKELSKKGKKRLLKSLQKPLTMIPPCSNVSLLTDYLNKPEVQAAIHVEPTEWELCNDHVHHEYHKQYKSARTFIENILSQEHDARVLLYFGDVDMVCNYIGGEHFVDNFGINITLSWRPWSIEKPYGTQIAGYVKMLDKLTFATVKGAGHMVPADKPQATFNMIQKFIDDEPF